MEITGNMFAAKYFVVQWFIEQDGARFRHSTSPRRSWRLLKKVSWEAGGFRSSRGQVEIPMTEFHVIKKSA